MTLNFRAGVALRLIVSLMLLVIIPIKGARADCSTPTAMEGALEYFTATSQYKVCDGTNWQTLNLGSTNAGACSTAAKIEYDTSGLYFKICDGTNYKKINSVQGGSCCTPTALGAVNHKSDVFPWTAISSVALSAGESLLVCVSSRDITIDSVTWNGTAMTKNATTVAQTHVTEIYSLINPTAGTGNLVVSITGASGTGKSLTAIKVSGLSSADKTAAASGGSSSTPSSGATATTASANQFLYGCVGTKGPVEETAGSWSNSFTNGQRSGTTGNASSSNSTSSEGYRTVTATGAYTAAKTGITATFWNGAIATFPYEAPSSYGACTKNGQLYYQSGSGLRWCDGGYLRQVLVP